MKQKFNPSYQRAAGYTLMELTLVIALLVVISFAFYYGGRFGHDQLKSFIGQKQAQSLVNNLRVDYQLVKARQDDVSSVADFFGYLYSQNWPIEEHGLFTSSAALEQTGTFEISADGCLVIDSVFLPCFTDQDGLSLQYRNQSFRPNLSRSQQKTMLGTDVKTVQNFYFQQTTSYTGVQNTDDSHGSDTSDVSDDVANAVESNFDANFDFLNTRAE